MNIFKCLAAAAAMILALGGVFAFTSRAALSDGDNSPGGDFRERVRQKLNLTDAQLAEIKIQLKAERSNLSDLLTRMHDARAALRAEIQKADATEASVRQAATKVSAVESDLAVERLKLHAKISPILTADQRAKLAELEANVDQFIERAISRIDAKLSDK